MKDYREAVKACVRDIKDISVDVFLIDRARILHFGFLLLTDNSAREATLFAVKYAKERGKNISYDLNYRPLL